MVSVDIREWPFLLWKFKNFQDLNTDVNKSVSVQHLNFNLTMKHFCNASLAEVHFQLHIEELPESTEETIILHFYARTYIIDKLENKRNSKCVEVICDGSRKIHCIWDIGRDEIVQQYKDLQQENGEVWLVCVFEPKSVLRKCHPKSMLDKSPWISLEALSSDFSSLRKTPGDITLTCGDNWIVHRNVLLARCPKLADKLNVASNSVVVLPDLDQSCVDFFINYVYTGCLPDIQLSLAQKLYIFGSVYELKDLMELCVKIMTSCLTEENMYDLLILAHKFEDSGFKGSITEYIRRGNILKTKRWIDFSDMHKDLALEVYRAFAAKQ